MDDGEINKSTDKSKLYLDTYTFNSPVDILSSLIEKASLIQAYAAIGTQFFRELSSIPYSGTFQNIFFSRAQNKRMSRGISHNRPLDLMPSFSNCRLGRHAASLNFTFSPNRATLLAVSIRTNNFFPNPLHARNNLADIHRRWHGWVHGRPQQQQQQEQYSYRRLLLYYERPSLVLVGTTTASAPFEFTIVAEFSRIFHTAVSDTHKTRVNVS